MTVSPELSVLLSSWSVQAIELDRPELAKAVEEIRGMRTLAQVAQELCRLLNDAGFDHHRHCPIDPCHCGYSDVYDGVHKFDKLLREHREKFGI